MRLITTLAVFFFLLISLSSYANDREIVGIGGSLKVLSGESKDISMESEDISMLIKKDIYKVVVNFVFKNYSSKNLTVKMGFPESGHGDIDVKSVLTKTAFISFKSYINGKIVETKRKNISNQDPNNDYSYETYWVKDVSFKPNEILKVKVEYTSKMGNVALPGIFAEYNFTGGNWKGKVKKSTLTAKLNLPKEYEYFPDERSKDVVIKKNMLYFSKTNWEADYYLPLFFINKSM